MKQVPEEVQQLLKTICTHFGGEDRAVRDRQIRQWRKLKYIWEGFQRLWWSETAHDWRVFDRDSAQEGTGDDGYYDKPVNVFKAYLESIIAALSVSIPAIECYPDDAENPLDMQTARAGNKIYDLVSKHNEAELLWLHALFILCTEGMIAAYNYTDEDEKYGTYDVNEYEDQPQEIQMNYCSLCGNQLGPVDLEAEDVHKDEYDPGNDDILADQDGKKFCANCLTMVDPEMRIDHVVITRMTGKTRKPKARQCIEVHGGLFVKVANYAQDQKGTPYLQYAYETHYANVAERYPDLRKKLSNMGPGQSVSGYDVYEQWGRVPTQYLNEYPMNNCTVQNWWLRPSAFNILKDEDDIALLNKHFPDGCKVVFINSDTFAEACNECLDDHWTLSRNPLADYIHHDPIGKVLVPIQEITNDLVSLVLQTIEHGIPQTFADPGVINFNAYKQMEAMPGAIIPAVPKSGQKVSDAFYEVKTATLSSEVLPVADKTQELGQLVSGALPTIFGGAVANTSKTASQYGMMRAQSLQRLQNHWKVLSSWWERIWGKVIPAYIKCVQEDERYVTKNKSGDFANILIRKAELEGKIGSICLEGSQELPISWAQRKEIVMTLLQAANPEVMAALSAPENIPILQEAIGLTGFYIPGEDDRECQREEINRLIESQPIQMPGQPMMTPQGPMMGPPQEQPSVQIEPMVDNNQIHAEICRAWLISDAGRLCKVENPDGYKNVLLHMQQHVQAYQQTQMQMASQQPNATGAGGPSSLSSGPQKQNENQFKPVAQPVNNNVNRATQ